MTANQIAYAQHVEQARANKAREKETNRSNLANEAEVQRHNVATEVEINRHNLVTEGQKDRELSIIEVHYQRQDAETERSHRANEALGWSNLNELQRSNLASENLRHTANVINMYNANTAARNADTAEFNANVQAGNTARNLATGYGTYEAEVARTAAQTEESKARKKLLGAQTVGEYVDVAGDIVGMAKDVGKFIVDLSGRRILK